jgi:CheY-like chemotaxis protein
VTSRSTVTGTILFVESDIRERMAATEYLRERGFRVIEALNVGEALQILRAGTKVDAVFSEVELDGGIDGFALARTARREFPALDVILASGPASQAQNSRVAREEDRLAERNHPNRLAGQ